MERRPGYDRVEPLADISLLERHAHHLHLWHDTAKVVSKALIWLHCDHPRPSSDKMPSHQPRPRPDLQNPATRSNTAPRPQHLIYPRRVVRPPISVTSGISP